MIAKKRPLREKRVQDSITPLELLMLVYFRRLGMSMDSAAEEITGALLKDVVSALIQLDVTDEAKVASLCNQLTTNLPKGILKHPDLVKKALAPLDPTMEAMLEGFIKGMMTILVQNIKKAE